ncbi:guanylate cyclase [Caballeronia humi]|uniref:Guanylate cyclase n=2 Tax=Caballeronia humi TaxID=326474 RepID=A0A158JEJ6_9BURK|nr:guanylate cyclase [Caballeronia humi]
MTFRPEFDPPWIGQPHVTTMVLGRLEQSDISALVETIAGNTMLPPEIVNEIVERTDGVPLFVEELTKAVVEAGFDGLEVASTLSRTPARTIPATLHASLMGRLNRLGVAKELAQIGAAIGREFTYELLAAVTSLSEPALRAGVNQLVASGLVFGRGMPPEASYLFRHALLQDAAYGTLLRGTRQQLHARIAEALEKRFPDRVIREPEVLGRHFSKRYGRIAPLLIGSRRERKAPKAQPIWKRSGIFPERSSQWGCFRRVPSVIGRNSPYKTRSGRR